VVLYLTGCCLLLFDTTYLTQKIFVDTFLFAIFFTVLKTRLFSGHNDVSYATINANYHKWSCGGEEVIEVGVWGKREVILVFLENPVES